MWIIEDWTGKRLFLDKTFTTFEDGWDFLLSLPEEEEWEDMYVVEVEAEEVA